MEFLGGEFLWWDADDPTHPRQGNLGVSVLHDFGRITLRSGLQWLAFGEKKQKALLNFTPMDADVFLMIQIFEISDDM